MYHLFYGLWKFSKHSKTTRSFAEVWYEFLTQLLPITDAIFLQQHLAYYHNMTRISTPLS